MISLTSEPARVAFTVQATPISTNMAYRLTKAKIGNFARMYLSAAAKSFKEMVSLKATLARPKGWPLDRRYFVGVDFYFRDNRPDSDGPLKLVLDAMEGCLYKNDRQVDEVRYRRFVDAASPRVEISVLLRTK